MKRQIILNALLVTLVVLGLAYPLIFMPLNRINRELNDLVVQTNEIAERAEALADRVERMMPTPTEDEQEK